MSYEIVSYSPVFRDEILRLQTHLWSPDLAVNDAYFRWKYERNPYACAPHVYLALQEGQVMGMRGFYGAQWETGNECELIVPCGGDTFVLPEHRRRGLFSKINAFAIKDLARLGSTHVFNFSAGPIPFLASRRQGWRFSGPFSMLRRSCPQGTAGEAHSSPGPNSDLCLEDTPKVEAMAALIRRLGHDGRIRHVRDRDFFGWRFDNPLCRYRFIYGGRDELRGYLVLRERLHRQESNLSVVDWEASDEHTEFLLLDAAIGLADRDPEIWSASISPKRRRRLVAYGFAPVAVRSSDGGYDPGVLVRAIQDDQGDEGFLLLRQRLLDIANWDLRMIYSDSY